MLLSSPPKYHFRLIAIIYGVETDFRIYCFPVFPPPLFSFLFNLQIHNNLFVLKYPFCCFLCTTIIILVPKIHVSMSTIPIIICVHLGVLVTLQLICESNCVLGESREVESVNCMETIG